MEAVGVKAVLKLGLITKRGGLFVMIHGTWMMPMWYADSLDVDMPSEQHQEHPLVKDMALFTWMMLRAAGMNATFGNAEMQAGENITATTVKMLVLFVQVLGYFVIEI